MAECLSRRKLLSLTGLSVSASLTGCASAPPRNESADESTEIRNLTNIEVERESFGLQELERESWPASQRDKCWRAPDEVTSAGATFDSGTRDGSGYNPVSMSRDLMTAARCYGVEGEPGGGEPDIYLERGRELHRHIVNNSLMRSDALYVPYTAGFRLHGEYGPLTAPWFSGMAQGLLLSAYARLYFRTNEAEYLDTADQLYKSLQQVRRGPDEYKPWVSLVTDDGYYWIEEYPRPDPTHVLNGFNFAIFGLFEFWAVLGQNGDERDSVRRTIEAALTTVKDHLDEWRDPGSGSYYCLKHREKNAKYHRIHYLQMQRLYRITNDEAFRNFANQLRNDAPVETNE